MNSLDDLAQIKEFDKASVLESIGLLPDQIEQAWSAVNQLSIPLRFHQAKNIVVAGMGGSALGAGIIDSLCLENLRLPLEVFNDYHLPAYAGQDSLVIISSYSGTTEETLSCALEAINRKCQIFVITTGGKLREMVRKNKLMAYFIEPKFNPAGQPRLGLGYSMAAQLTFLKKCGFIDLEETWLIEAITYLRNLKTQFAAETPIEGNAAKRLSLSLQDKIPVLISGQHLAGANHAIANMINENSKMMSIWFSLPEMNHHLLEGLSNPALNRKILKFLFIDSDLYEDKIQKRIKITKDVVKKNKLGYESFTVQGKTKLIQALEAVYFGGFLSFYLAFLNGVNPVLIPWVDYFKERLAE
ncbi:MAG TPA: bifunctional phosphoglucose/phosphomannose isomerase [Candidatus Bathyarchaeia archaeon]|nr:bifunctional phosphoglucose/phosphomannose isomerase [Candidatus Bathyarchaeia archaeon]